MSSLRRQVLLPFAVGVTLLVLVVSGLTTLSTRRAASEEIDRRAGGSAQVFDGWLKQHEAELMRKGYVMARQMAAGEMAAGRADRVTVPLLARQHDFVRIVDERRSVTRLMRGVDWDGIGAQRRLVAGARLGVAGSGVAMLPNGTAVVVSAVPARIKPGSFGVVLVGDVLDGARMRKVERPLGVRLEIESEARGEGTGAAAAGSRRVSFALPTIAGGGRARLAVTVSTKHLTDTTRHAAFVAGGTGLFVATLLVGLLSFLLTSTVIAPLRGLRRAIDEVTRGHFAVRLPLVGPSELRDVASGFSHMATLVGQQQERLEGLAATDALTGLANHRRFHEALEAELARAATEGTALTLVALDLDHFKTLNDVHGHPCGDEVLRAAGPALSGAVRACDLVARVGGEEFALLLPGADVAVGWEVAERARAAIAAIRVADFEPTASAGLASYPNEAGDGPTLLELADRALYDAKRGGRAQTRRHDRRRKVPTVADRERAEIERLLEDPSDIVALFQPVVDLTSGQVLGYEGLSRFAVTPVRPPDAWFAQAARCGLGPELETAALVAFLAVPDRPPGTFLSLNLSPSALVSELVRAALPQDMSGLVVEVTEHEAMVDDEVLRSHLRALRARGARIALDDVGAGYAGLQAVVRLEPDVIKLDRSLVDGINADLVKVALVESFVRFARRTGATVCAEGIETLDDLNVLADLDVSYGQGYVLARPGPPWTSVSPSVAAVLLRRSVAGSGDLAGAGPIFETSDHRLERVSAAMSAVTSAGDLPALFRLIALDLRADDLAFSRWDRQEGVVEAVGDISSWIPAGERFAVDQFPSTDHVLRTQESAQVLMANKDADRAEVELLLEGPYRSLLMVPVVFKGTTVGLLEAFRVKDEAWQRSDVHRARTIAYGLGAVLEAVKAPAPPRRRAVVTSLDERRRRVG